MIRTESFTVSRETFATERKQVLTDAADELRPHIADALNRVGLPGWETPVVSAALDLFDSTARAEVDEWGPVLDDMHDLFAEQLAETLAKTTASGNPAAQLEVITGWVAQMAHNAAIEAATTSDPDANVGLEWVTMGDGKVRDSHQEANGQNVPTGGEFEVDGEKLLYPGQPVGDPSVWLNCRCLARPTMLDSEMAAKTLTASAAEPFTSATIMAIPTDSDPVTAISSEPDGAHCTLLFLGETAALDKNLLVSAIQSFIEGGNVTPITDAVNGRATLGKDEADVALLDAANLIHIRNGLLEQNTIADAYLSVEQFPTWIPHVTLGYPAAPAVGEFKEPQITFDRIALWFGEDRTAVFQLGEAMPEKEIIHPEDGGFTQEMADAVFASTPEKEPAEAAPATEAPAAPADTEAGPTLRPWHGVLAPEGAPSGDKRGFAARMLTMRDLPLPLKVQFVDDEGHKGSVVVGRIDEVYRDGGLIKASGVWDNSPDADRAFDLIDKRMLRGVSVDLDAVEGEMVEAAKEGGQPTVEFTEGRVCSATICAIPAFAEAFVRNGTWEQFASEPLPTGEMVEIPDWPAVSLVASGAPVISADYFRNPMLTELTPVTRGEDGLVYGHLGGWDTCHIAYEICTTVPPSETDYAYFLTGQVFTDAGPVAVGQLTVGGGHADMKLGIRAAMAHYDNVSTAVADITVGEDEFGVWFSGRIRPWATAKQIHEMFAAGPSGDWREVRHGGRESMEMIAAHSVNVQGFPVPRTRFAVENGRTTSLVAAGFVRSKTKEVEEVFSDLRGMKFADVFNEISTLKGN